MRYMPKLDLHGRLEDEVFDLLDRFIRQNKDKEQVLVVVGKGKGIIKKAVLDYLKITKYSWAYDRTGGCINEGALIIDLY